MHWKTPFLTHPESDHFSLLPLPPPWSEPPSSVTWCCNGFITSMLALLCPLPQPPLNTSATDILVKPKSDNDIPLLKILQKFLWGLQHKIWSFHKNLQALEWSDHLCSLLTSSLLLLAPLLTRLQPLVKTQTCQGGSRLFLISQTANSPICLNIPLWWGLLKTVPPHTALLYSGFPNPLILSFLHFFFFPPSYILYSL